MLGTCFCTYLLPQSHSTHPSRSALFQSPSPIIHPHRHHLKIFYGYSTYPSSKVWFIIWVVVSCWPSSALDFLPYFLPIQEILFLVGASTFVPRRNFRLSFHSPASKNHFNTTHLPQRQGKQQEKKTHQQLPHLDSPSPTTSTANPVLTSPRLFGSCCRCSPRHAPSPNPRFFVLARTSFRSQAFCSLVPSRTASTLSVSHSQPPVQPAGEANIQHPAALRRAPPGGSSSSLAAAAAASLASDWGTACLCFAAEKPTKKERPHSRPSATEYFDKS